MAKRSSKRQKDENELAAGMVRRLTGQSEPAEPPVDPELVSKVMAAMGRKGGKKGGPARAKALTAKRRAEIARKAAAARWKPR